MRRSISSPGLTALLCALTACSNSGNAPSPGQSDATTDAQATTDAAQPGDATIDANDTGQGDGAVDAGPADDLGPMSAYCARFATATCDRRASCSGSADPACVPTITAQCLASARGQIVEALEAGVIAFDPAKAATCFASPPADFCQPQNFGTLEACQGVFAGTVALGAPCMHVYMFGDVDECKDGQCSVGEVFGACVPGTCQPFPDAGAPCADDAGNSLGVVCAPGFWCINGACTKEGNLGDPCESPGELCRPTWPQIECAPLVDGGLACDGPRAAGALCAYQGAGVDEVCQSQICGDDGGCSATTADGGTPCGSSNPPCPTGAVCQSNGQDPRSCRPPLGGGATCAPGDVCVAGFACAVDGGAGACSALPGIGAPCSGGCAPGAICSSFADAGTCAAIVANGGACRGAGDDVCAPGSTCSAASKTCSPFAAWGAPCVVDGDCESGLYCDDTARVCQTWKRNGQPCSRDSQCIAALGCTGGTCRSSCSVP